MLLCIARDARPVLAHTHDGRIDHLDCHVISSGQGIHNLVPYATSLPPANEAIVAGR
jgi:hypothetical protein